MINNLNYYNVFYMVAKTGKDQPCRKPALYQPARSQQGDQQSGRKHRDCTLCPQFQGRCPDRRGDDPV